MSTVEKDFRVKNGLNVANGATFGGTVTIAEPTQSSHAATRSYVDALAIAYSQVAPLSPANGAQWFDSSIGRLKIYHNQNWVTLAVFEDFVNLPQHIHDTSIGGSGLIVSSFTNGGSAIDPQINTLDAGDPNTTFWSIVLDGGNASSNFI